MGPALCDSGDCLAAQLPTYLVYETYVSCLFVSRNFFVLSKSRGKSHFRAFHIRMTEETTWTWENADIHIYLHFWQLLSNDLTQSHFPNIPVLRGFCPWSQKAWKHWSSWTVGKGMKASSNGYSTTSRQHHNKSIQKKTCLKALM